MKEKLIKMIDLALARIASDRCASDLVVFAFHSVLDQAEDLRAELLDPFQPVTLHDIETLISLLLQRGFAFVTGRHLDAGTVIGPAAWLTFDDGYANNLKLLPLLHRRNIPATIFISTAYIGNGEAYWWDVLFRESRKRGASHGEIAIRREGLKALPPQRIRAVIAAEFGEGAMRPVGQHDRPMTPAEVSTLSRESLVEIGNHTHSHTILTVVDVEAQRMEIHRCQRELCRLTGEVPVSIAFPNGDFTAHTVEAAAGLGLKIGVTCLPSRTDLASLDRIENRLTIGRFGSIRHGRLKRELALATARTSIAMSIAERRREQLVMAPNFRR